LHLESPESEAQQEKARREPASLVQLAKKFRDAEHNVDVDPVQLRLVSIRWIASNTSTSTDVARFKRPIFGSNVPESSCLAAISTVHFVCDDRN